ncbi:MAG: M28 family peptidase [Salinivirgaceae bacterium]|jgi:hypothetical protein|nr:M28 family peptidase [Salinivirgaceae bacterium]
MKLISTVIITICCVVNSFTQNLQPSTDTIKSHVYYLASDELKGRDTGKEGQRIAAKYIAEKFRQYGLGTYDENGYNHYYHLKRKHINHLVVKNNGNILYWPWHFYYVTGYTHSDTIDTKLAFVGYGSNKEIEALDIEGKAVAFMAESPQNAYDTLIRIASEKGVKTFFVMFPKGSEDVSIVWGNEYQLSSYNLPEIFERKYIQKVRENWAVNTDSLNIYYCFPNVLRNVFMLDDKELEKVAKDNTSNNYTKLSSIIQPDISCLINYNDSIEDIKVENVAGFIYGEDTSKTVVVSAHYDHIGEVLGEINYGADDNASGTAALLESARLMSIDARNGIKPKINVLFVAFSGEEMGLLGSKAFVNDPAVDLSKIKLNINMDMVGRWDSKHEKDRSFVYILAAGDNAKQLFSIGKKQLNKPKGFNVSNKPGGREKVIFKYGSDHYSFLNKNIPISVFFTGLHDDYHTPGDTPDKINYENLTNITSTVYQYIYKVAELE